MFKRNSSPRHLADIGVLNLVDGQSDKAVVALAKAAERDPSDASIWSDLSAAYLAKAEGKSLCPDVLLALEAAERAVTLDPELQEARFNQALAMDHLSLRFRARSAWARFLDLDDRSPWAREAEERFAALVRPGRAETWVEHRAAFEAAPASEQGAAARQLVSLFPQQTRELAEEELLGHWAVARSHGDAASAERILSSTRSLGDALAEAHGDHMVQEAVRAIDFGSPSLAVLVAGHLRYQEGLKLYRESSYEAAAKVFFSAAESLGTAGTPFRLWARFRSALCEHQLYHYDGALQILDGLLREPDISQFPALRARTFWLSGLIRGILGDMAEAVADYRRALEIFDLLNERGNLALAGNLLAEVHRKLGDLPGAWKFHTLALEGLPWVASSARRQPILEELGISLHEAGRPRLAIYFQEESLRNGAGEMAPAILAGRLRRMAEAQYQQGNSEKALVFLRQAERVASSISAMPQREALLGDLLATEGKIEADVDPGRASRTLMAAITTYERTDYRQQLIQLHLQRARALRRQSRYRSAEASLLRAIELIGAYRPARDVNSTTFGEVRLVFDEMVLLQVVQGHFEAALEYAERGRSKILSLMDPEPSEGGALSPLTSAEIRKNLPSATAVVELWVGERDLFLWAIRRDGIHFVAVPLDSQRLDRLAGRFRRAIAAEDKSTADRLGRQLHAALVAPLEAGLQGADRLVFIPDRKLYSIPFAALRSSGRQEYLIESHALSVSPSASLYIWCLRRQRELARLPSGVLAFGNPAFDNSLFPMLASLPGSEEEAKQILKLYPSGKVILGAAATRDRLLAEVGGWPVLHFGGHAVSNPENPFLSALVLAPEKMDSGVFYMRDLTGSRLKRTRLVFLAACSTLLGGSFESGPSIAAPLLARGAPAVIGTLWPVYDLQAGGLALEFHRRFAAERDAARALRETQIEFLSTTGPKKGRVFEWAAFQLIGA